MVSVLPCELNLPTLDRRCCPSFLHESRRVTIQGVSASIGDDRRGFEPLLCGLGFLTYSLSMNSAGFGAPARGLPLPDFSDQRVQHVRLDPCQSLKSVFQTTFPAVAPLITSLRSNVSARLFPPRLQSAPLPSGLC